ncbi:hypothetical protein PHYSODRAFT_489016 [Phytophthora sojae]|uniref:DDE Tnp4 domain-containing protein n=1 Tax=Phytophthora sojae (strain P6497) TaxID=1094619 RepID=G4Z472_PHYSP|nr:hypothetical protein PHYSODRAFT_489016 [Phytophthora sojae]EGZ22266.1 hypothetical protein PHYSODRAFT_489016 [Phytophthora sojae]|eukprot:XP_009524983.1 hypothetical protein PHYSODRAFT_489016 [Phytophthora sojae]
MLSEEEAVCLLSARTSSTSNVPRSISYGDRFNINALNDYETRFYFRFWKRDLFRLFEALRLDSSYKLPNRAVFSGFEGFCILLRRMAYPGRYGDLSRFFGRSAPIVCVIFNFMLGLVYDKYKCLLTIECGLLTSSRLEEYAAAVAQRGAPEPRCIGFIDGTVRAIARPTRNQKQVYNGHKRKHALKHQGIMAPDGLFIDFYGPTVGRRHDSWLLRQSGLLERLLRVLHHDGELPYCIYGDPAYPLKPTLHVGFKGSNLSDTQKAFNAAMSKVRVAVEWGFGGIIRLWPFLVLRLSQRLYLSPVGKRYLVGVLLTNFRNCSNPNQISKLFSIKPPSLEEYLSLATTN